MKRFVEFDILRGVLLLMMVVDHSPSALRRFTDQPLGFFTTAEPWEPRARPLSLVAKIATKPGLACKFILIQI
jgi:uncharacterized membrane protein